MITSRANSAGPHVNCRRTSESVAAMLRSPDPGLPTYSIPWGTTELSYLDSNRLPLVQPPDCGFIYIALDASWIQPRKLRKPSENYGACSHKLIVHSVACIVWLCSVDVVVVCICRLLYPCSDISIPRLPVKSYCNVFWSFDGRNTFGHGCGDAMETELLSPRMGSARKNT